MAKLRNIIYVAISIPVFLMLVWLFAIPDNLIREKIEDAIARSGNSNRGLSINGLKKGIFFIIYADSLKMKINNRPALEITDFAGSFSPRYLTDKKLGFAIRGKIGTGDINGILKLPLEGNIKIDRAELTAIPYLMQFDMDINGNVFSDINIRNDIVKVIFEVPDLNIDDSTSVIPLLNTFHRLQGALLIKGNTIKINSISLKGDKGYARLKGDIKNNVMDLILELMPIKDKLNALESMMIGKYIVSPGYYVVPIKGPLP
jgi:hypothetical protein